MAQGPGARVYRGFEESIRAAMATILAARQLVVLLPQHHFEEFVPGLLPDFRALLARGGSLRFLVVGRADPEVTRDLLGLGAEVRLLEETREVGIVATDQRVLLFPPDQRPESPLTVCLLEVDDPVAVAHFRLAFERAWESGRPVQAPRAMKRGPGKRARQA